MKSIALNLCAATLALGSVASAQEAGRQDKKPVPAAGDPIIHLYKLSDLDDLNLKNGETTIGEVDGFVLDSRDGSIVFALVGKGGVLGIGEEQHLVPWESIRVTVKDKAKEKANDKDRADAGERMKARDLMATTALTEEQIKAAPVFKKDVRIDAATVRTIRENAKLGSDSRWENVANDRLVTASELRGMRVASTDEKDIGEIDEIIVAPKDGMIAYTVVGVGGVLGMGEKSVALPWGILETSYADGKIHARLPVTKERLEKAPDYDADDWKRASSPVYVREISTYWSKDPFWIRATPASADRR